MYVIDVIVMKKGKKGTAIDVEVGQGWVGWPSRCAMTRGSGAFGWGGVWAGRSVTVFYFKVEALTRHSWICSFIFGEVETVLLI